MDEMLKLLTTGEVAKICQVSARTVCNWIDNGLLVGFLLPGTKHRRVPKAVLVQFMRDKGIPEGMSDAV